jgi:halocyanin-like protein
LPIGSRTSWPRISASSTGADADATGRPSAERLDIRGAESLARPRRPSEQPRTCSPEPSASVDPERRRGDRRTDGGADDGGNADTVGVDDWLSDAGSYDAVVDETGVDTVTVAVGADGNGGGVAFDPPAARVSTDTTVVWGWTGEGGQHNVVAEEGGDFESELTAETGSTFERTLAAPGPVTYVYTPHRSLGMKGAVIVE